jgi:opacity protein-like surface antigen
MMYRFPMAAAAALAGFMSFATPVFGENDSGGVYASSDAGGQAFSDNEDVGVDTKHDTGLVSGGLVGIRFSDLRAEAEIDHQSTSAGADIVGARTVDVDINRYTASLYYRLSTLQLPVTPYVGGGAGLATIKASNGGNDATNFTWHGELGGSVAVNHNLSIVPTYRYEWTSNNGLVSDSAITSHAFRVGVHWIF